MLVLGELNLNLLSKASDYLKETCGNLFLIQLVTESTQPNLKDPTKPTLIERPLAYVQTTEKSLCFTIQNSQDLKNNTCNSTA